MIEPDFNLLHPSPTAPRVIGLAGYARAGKDTVGQTIHRLYGHTVLSYSDILREFIYAQDLYIPHPKDEYEAIRLNEEVDLLGWEKAREAYPYIRTLQQKTGQEAARAILGGDVWVNAWTARASSGLWVNPSVRYPNEVEAIRKMGGVVIRVIRPGVTAVNDHISDRALDGYPLDNLIVNDGSLVDLEGEVQNILGEFNGQV